MIIVAEHCRVIRKNSLCVDQDFELIFQKVSESLWGKGNFVLWQAVDCVKT